MDTELDAITFQWSGITCLRDVTCIRIGGHTIAAAEHPDIAQRIADLLNEHGLCDLEGLGQ